MFKSNQIVLSIAFAACLFLTGCSRSADSESKSSAQSDDLAAHDGMTDPQNELAANLVAGPELSELEFGPDNILFAASGGCWRGTGSTKSFQLRDDRGGPIPFLRGAGSRYHL